MEKLLEALSNFNIEPPKCSIGSNHIHRWGRNNRYWAKRFDGGYVFGDFVNDLSAHVFDNDNVDYKQVKNIPEKAKSEAAIEQTKIHEEASVRANAIWMNSKLLTSHGYLSKKHISAHGLREYKGCITIPLYDMAGKIWSLQFIDVEGNKRFLSAGKKKGCYFILGDISNAFRWATVLPEKRHA
jgi:putative DNA primase/helicase